ncbi:MAG: enoyl-CoA hydratase-related protein [Acidimicrobiia bacterium]|nr:enoyl-CoA hydratase-related protein [Acidimicrobiia bacterium]
MADGRVDVEDVEGLRVLVLSRPGKLNGMDTPMLESLLGAVREATSDRSVRAVLLTGEGEAFSAGGDPDELTGIAGHDVLDTVDRWTGISTEVAGLIFHAEKPVVAAVDGPAFGAGCALALACDVVLASERARFGPVFTQRGILPDHALLWFLPRQIGLLAAKELILSGRVVEAAEADRLGLCTRVLPAEGFAEAARGYALDLARGPTRALAAAKLVMNKGLETDMWTVQAFERMIQPSLFASDDFREGFAAFRERRRPRFGGR